MGEAGKRETEEQPELRVPEADELAQAQYALRTYGGEYGQALAAALPGLLLTRVGADSIATSSAPQAEAQ